MKVNYMNSENMKYYNETNTCCRCGIKFEVATGHPYREYNKEGDLTGKWLCKNCYSKDYNKRPDCTHAIMKSLTNRRTGNQDPNSSNAKGDRFQKLTCIWLDVDDLNIINDNYTSSIDHSRHPKLGIIQTNGRFYDSYNQWWQLNTRRSVNKDYDSIVFYCASKDGRIIERIYIFPWEEILERNTVTVAKNPLRGSPWYEKYRVTDEEVIKKVNDIWKKI